MAAQRNDESGLELAELSVLRSKQRDGSNDNQLGDSDDGDMGVQRLGRGRRERDQDAEDRAPLLVSDAEAKAARRARRAQKREEEASRLRRQLRLLWKTSCGLLAVGTLVSAAATLLATVELRRHLGRIFFAMPLMLHLLLDAIAAITPLLAAKSDGQSEPPPPRPMSQVEFQRQLRAGQTPQHHPLHDDGRDCCCCRPLDANDDDDDAPCSLRVTKGLALAIVLGYVVLDAVSCALLSAGFVGAARGLGIEADGTIAPERTGAHAALTAVGVIVGVAAGVRVLASLSIAVYLRGRFCLLNVLRGSEPPWHYTMSHKMERLALRQAAGLVAGASVLLLVGVGSHLLHWTVDTGGKRHFDRCDPLDATMCALPFPSSYFLIEEASSSTGFRVSFGPRSLPYTRGRRNISPDAINALDGFSTLAPILFYLEGMSASGFVGPGNIGASLFMNSTTWLIEADTERMVPHFVELDALDPHTPLAVLQPAVPLRHATRYIVAVCGALGEWWELLSPTPGFRELVEASQADRTTRIRPELRLRAEHFSEQVFPVLRRKVADSGLQGDGGTVTDGEEGMTGLLGVGLGDVQLAWDFVTASEEGQLGGLRAMRDTMLAWLDRALSAEGCAGGEDGVGESNASCEEGHGERGRLMRADVMTSSEGNFSGRRLRSGDNSDGDIRRDPRSDERTRNEGVLADGEGSLRSRTSGVSGTPVEGRPPSPAMKDQISARFLSSSSMENSSAKDIADHGSGGELTTLAPYRVLKVEVEKDSPIGRTVWARMRVPAFVSPRTRGAGLVVQVAAEGDHQEEEAGVWGKRLDDMETLEVGFVVRVPHCVSSGERAPARVVQFGHGMFGDRSEVMSGFLGELAESGAWVLVAADWRGLSRIDLVTVAGALVSRPEVLFAGIADDLMQGFVNQEAVLTLVSRRLGDFLGDEAVVLAKQGASGTAVPCGFYGISQGAILGAGYSEFSTMVERSVLGSGGTPFSFLMPRSVDFTAYRDLLQLNVPRARDVRLLLSLLQMSWDRLEASAWLAGPPLSAEHVGEGNAAAVRQKAVLMQGGTGDAEVSIIGTEILARAYNATVVPPVSEAAWGIPAPTSGTAHCVENEEDEWSCCFGEGGGASLAVYNYEREAAEVPADDTPPPPGLVHLCVRHDPAARQQVLKFIETGCVVNFCEGICDRPYCSPSP